MLGKVPLFINTLESIKVAQSIGAEGVYLEEGISHSRSEKHFGRKSHYWSANKDNERCVNCRSNK